MIMDYFNLPLPLQSKPIGTESIVKTSGQAKKHIPVEFRAEVGLVDYNGTKVNGRTYFGEIKAIETKFEEEALNAIVSNIVFSPDSGFSFVAIDKEYLNGH